MSASTTDCIACHGDHVGGMIIETRDEVAVRLCHRCNTDYNVDVARTGVWRAWPDGSPRTLVKLTAELSTDGRYRYNLTRSWLVAGGTPRPPVVWIALNPSDADDQRGDPTEGRMIEFTRAWRHHRLIVVNAFAFRSSKPAALPRELAMAAGPLCGDVIAEAMGQARNGGKVIACWGAPSQAWLAAMLRDRERAIVAMAAARGITLMAIGTTNAGAPKHPLARGVHRVPYTVALQPWSPPQ